MTKLHALAALGQSIWVDTIRRDMLHSGELQTWINQGLRGLTSNPTIFEKTISASREYTSDLQRMAYHGMQPVDIFFALAIQDIKAAADLFRPLYVATHRQDGYVSLEVNPHLAGDTQATLAEARRLWERVSRPNLMVKIPATLAGLPAITSAISAGVNVNVTLIFSLERYRQVMRAYLDGLTQRLETGQSIEHIHSVASFFVSRVDTKLDPLLKSAGAEQFQGKAAVANARLAYQDFRAIFEGKEFAALQKEGANLQRPLWASTSTKNPAYPDLLYVESLIGKHTVNTAPEDTIRAFIDHGDPKLSLESGLDDSHQLFEAIAKLGISMEQVTGELEDEGVASFSKSFDSLLRTIQLAGGQ